MAGEGQRPWERLIRDLHRGITLLDQEIELLRHIDKTILEIPGGDVKQQLKALFLESSHRFSKAHRTEHPVLCYVNLGDELALLGSDGAVATSPSRIPVTAALKPLLESLAEAPLGSVLLNVEHKDDLFLQFLAAKT